MHSFGKRHQPTWNAPALIPPNNPKYFFDPFSPRIFCGQPWDLEHAIGNSTLPQNIILYQKNFIRSIKILFADNRNWPTFVSSSPQGNTPGTEGKFIQKWGERRLSEPLATTEVVGTVPNPAHDQMGKINWSNMKKIQHSFSAQQPRAHACLRCCCRMRPM